MQIVGVQLDPVWHNKIASHKKVNAMLADVKLEPHALIVLPEMFATGFDMNVAAICDDDRATQKFLAQLAQQHKAFIVAGLVTRGKQAGRNEAVVFNPDGRELTRYCKMHPFSFAGESQHYEPGEGLTHFAWHHYTVCPLICYDLRFPEAFRAALQHHVNIYVVIANWPTSRISHWVTLLAARAIENQAYVIGINRTGNDPNLSYPGRSIIIDPRGNILIEAADIETIITATLDPAEPQRSRDKFPALRDRRADLTPTT